MASLEVMDTIHPTAILFKITVAAALVVPVFHHLAKGNLPFVTHLIYFEGQGINMFLLSGLGAELKVCNSAVAVNDEWLLRML
jgi:hypothetical protein